MGAGRIPDSVMEDVLKRSDIVDVIGKYVHLTKRGRNLMGLCPFHSEKSPSFSVSPEKQLFHCFGCKKGGSVITFLREIEGYTFEEAVLRLAEEAGISVNWEPSDPVESERRQEREQMIEAHELAARTYHYILVNTEEGKQALDYLQSRGISGSLIETFQIGFAPDRWEFLSQLLEKRGFSLPLMEKAALVAARSAGEGYVDRFRNRIMFPIRDAKGSVIAFAGRTMGQEQPKYLNSPETALFRKSKVLYNFHAARSEMKRSGHAILFEGYLDVIKAWSAGIHNGVATMGTALTEEHALQMRRSAALVTICFDGDDAGQSAAYKSLAILEKAGIDTRVAVIPDKLDPDEYIGTFGAEAFQRNVLQGALPAVKFRLVHLRKNFNMADNDAKRRYVQTAIREVIAKLDSPTERDFYLRELSSEFTGISSYETMKQEMFETRAALQKKRRNGDNNEYSWNNVRNDGVVKDPLPGPVSAYEKAYRHLLYMMMHDRDLAAYVQERLGEPFSEDPFAALAAYLYSYYAQGFEPDPGRYIAMLMDERLERLASSILIQETDEGVNEQVIEDYIKQIDKHRRLSEIERLERQMKQAEGEKDYLRAAQIAIEITTLKNQLKAM